ncbi:hypothetical protein F8388_014284 [Cannabis sativa]|uniref:CCHC-type domain-containing protein n=1 Tax=Cannabis sativa TaxID=3483 RepID=A0A7J6GQR3_CANSA|nr:hypothetical protein F8388_014284 [Cannabis sativa]
MEELLSKTTQLHVSDEEEWEVDHSLSTTIAKNNLRGRLCSNVDHSRGLLKKVLGRIWRLKEGDWNVKIQEKYDSEMVNTSESWKNDLTAFPIWRRALGVPVDYLTVKNTLRLASMAGTIWMSINKPVWPVNYLLPYGGSKVWVAYKYDELPYMCFRCGRIGHSQKDCSLDIKEVTGAEGDRAKAYGTWLKVGNEIRDGFHDERRGLRKEIQMGEMETLGAIQLKQGLRVSNSFEPLVETTDKGKISSDEIPLMREQFSSIMEASERAEIELVLQKKAEKVILENLGIQEDGGRGKRRMVEDWEAMGVGKLLKTRRKVAVKKDAKNKKGRIDGMPIGLRAEALRVSLGFVGCFVVEAHGKSGGLIYFRLLL